MVRQTSSVRKSPPSPLPRLRKIAAASSSGSEDDNAALVQSRLALWAKVGAAACTGLLLLIPLLLTIAPPPLPLSPAWHGGVHILLILCLVAIWLVTRGRPRGPRTLRAIDAMGVFVVSAVATTLDARSPLPLRPDLTMVIGVAYLLVTRAAVVPSSPRWTMAVGALASLPPLTAIALMFGLFRPTDAPASLPSAAHACGFAVIWQALALATTAVISGIIYGLRKQVRQAERLGQYTLEEKLGEGGIGAVYKARHALLQRPTAVKLLRPEHSRDPGLIRRFEREVQLCSQLSHPGTVAVYDFGHTPEGIFYYVMEYLEGLNLAALVARDGPQPPARVVRLLVQACGALAEAHDVGLIHRDIKPANLVLCCRGGEADVLKVLDYGLVKDLHAGTDLEASQQGMLVGTPRYLPPESIHRPQAVDARADIYGLGAVAYHLLCGADPFVATSWPQLLLEIATQVPPPPSSRLGRSLPGGLELLVLRCLAKDPACRPQTARTLAAELLASTDLDGWTEADARTWWASHCQPAPSQPSSREVDVGLQKTLAAG
jgi:serine/threonine-protein kinase